MFCKQRIDEYLDTEYPLSMRATYRTVSREFRQLLAKSFPNLGNNQAYWLLLSYLFFGTFVDEPNNRLVIPASLLADIENKTKQLKSKNYTGSVFLEAFKKDILPSLVWSPYSKKNKEARTIISFELPKEIDLAVKEERGNKGRNLKNLVYIHDGSEFTRKKQLEYQEVAQSKATELIRQAHCPEQKELLDYMNSLASNRIRTMVVKNFQSAVEEAKRSDDSIHQLNILNAVYDQCKPFYKPVLNSIRIYSLNENLLMLKKTVKQKLLPDLIEVDLKSAQLAIAATLWNLPTVKEFLQEKKSIWEDLAKHYGRKLTPELKSIFKDCLYATMYGMTHVKLIKTLNEKLGSSKPFFSCHIIKLLLQERKKQLEKITKNEGATNCFGQFISIKKFPYKTKGARSILAQLSQSYELKILYPILQLARKYNDKNAFTIILWQHDGFSWVPNRSSGKAMWLDILHRAVYETAKSLDVITSLKVSYDPDKSE